ncbi:uncharacterized protein METZ01_LOCUS180940, partial [marine metagenome]
MLFVIIEIFILPGTVRQISNHVIVSIFKIGLIGPFVETINGEHMVINISFIGLGKLGLDCAESFATKYQVVGYDI